MASGQVLVLGDSFVRRLLNIVGTDEVVRNNNVILNGLPGADVSRLLGHVRTISLHSYYAAVIQIGSNDLSNAVELLLFLSSAFFSWQHISCRVAVFGKSFFWRSCIGGVQGIFPWSCLYWTIMQQCPKSMLFWRLTEAPHQTSASGNIVASADVSSSATMVCIWTTVEWKPTGGA